MSQQAAPATVTKIPRNAVRRLPYRWLNVIVEPRTRPRDQLIQKPVYTDVSAGRDIVHTVKGRWVSYCYVDTVQGEHNATYQELKVRLRGSNSQIALPRALLSTFGLPLLQSRCCQATQCKPQSLEGHPLGTKSAQAAEDPVQNRMISCLG